MPVTITRPLTLRIIWTAAVNGPPSPSWIAAISALMPPASASSVRTAEAIRLCWSLSWRFVRGLAMRDGESPWGGAQFYGFRYARATGTGNHSLTISVLPLLTEGLADVAGLMSKAFARR